MKLYNVVLEIEIPADSPLDAAKTLDEWIKDPVAKWIYEVQDDETKEIFTVDFDFGTGHEVLNTDYNPIIEL